MLDLGSSVSLTIRPCQTADAQTSYCPCPHACDPSLCAELMIELISSVVSADPDGCDEFAILVASPLTKGGGGNAQCKPG